jgi:predicted permease
VWSAEWYPVSTDYFSTLGIPLLRGRAINAGDAYATRPVAVINASMARRFWPNEDPIGKLMQLDLLDDRPREIVGVVGDVRQNRYERELQPQMYVPRAQLPLRMDMALSLKVLVATFIVRTDRDLAGISADLRAAVREIDRVQPISRISTVENYAAGQLQQLRQYAVLLTTFGAAAAVLAVIGLFGIMVHTVSQRTREIGVRIALGARSTEIANLVLQEGLRVVALGIAIGAAASFMLTRVIQNFLWGVTATDPLTFVAVAGLLAAVAMFACYLPARRALRVDPVIALRME